jgi:hypothetical protein
MSASLALDIDLPPIGGEHLQNPDGAPVVELQVPGMLFTAAELPFTPPISSTTIARVSE